MKMKLPVLRVLLVLSIVLNVATFFVSLSDMTLVVWISIIVFVVLLAIYTSIRGKQLEANLDAVHITANKNTVPGEKRSPFVTSGVRLGTPAVTTRGMGPAEMKIIADCIADCIFDFEGKKADIIARVDALTERFPLYE